MGKGKEGTDVDKCRTFFFVTYYCLKFAKVQHADEIKISFFRSCTVLVLHGEKLLTPFSDVMMLLLVSLLFFCSWQLFLFYCQLRLVTVVVR